MMHSKFPSLFCLITALAVLATTEPAMSAELVINGDFEADIDEFVTWPGYVGDNGNPLEVPDWLGTGGRGINPVQPEEGGNPADIPLWFGTGGRGINPVGEPDDDDPHQGSFDAGQLARL